MCALAALSTWAAAGGIPQAEYRGRRAALRKSLEGAVLVLFGRTAAEMDDHSAVSIQEPQFDYLTGWEEPGAVMLLTSGREVLFLPAHNQTLERYTGRHMAAADPDARAATGFDEVLPSEQFEAQFANALESSARILTLTNQAYAEKLKRLAPLREVADAAPLLGPLRAKKSAAELAILRRAADVSVDAHRAAWKRIEPGLFEYQVAATMTYTMLDAGCEGNAYEPIVGSGPNATVLHYSKDSRRMEAGELALMDVAAECGGYASDITRTVPVSGKFTPRQRELYDIVLGAQQAALAAVRPGVTLQELNRIAREYLDKHGKDRSGAPLGKYLTHRISHGVGIEVHDYPAASFASPLEAGMVITLEPGLYIPEEVIGIRIEDTVLVTESGSRVLTGALPKSAAEIESAMRK